MYRISFFASAHLPVPARRRESSTTVPFFSAKQIRVIARTKKTANGRMIIPVIAINLEKKSNA
jgi:hypothetical protein